MSNEEMAVRIQAGEREHLPALWERVERFVGMMAGRLYGRMPGRCDACGCTVDDLKQAGFLALVDAIAAFDPARGYKLLSWLRYPLKNHWNALLGLRTEKQRGDPLNSAGSLDEPVSEEGNTARGELVPDPTASQAFEDAIETEWLRQLRAAEEAALQEIDDPAVIRDRYFEGLTLDGAAQRLGVSRERVRQREQKALRQLRHPRIAKSLRPFCPERVESLALRGTGLQAFRHGGSATERAVETLDREERERRFCERMETAREADRKLRAALAASRAGEPVALDMAFEEWRASLRAGK